MPNKPLKFKFHTKNLWKKYRQKKRNTYKSVKKKFLDSSNHGLSAPKNFQKYINSFT